MIGPTAADLYRSSIPERYGLEPSQASGPSLSNAYDRITLAGTVTTGRTTVDHALGFLDPADRCLVGGLREDLVLIETRSTSGGGSVDRALRGLGVRPRRVDTYGIGLGFVHPGCASNRDRRATAYAFADRRVDPDERAAVPAPPVSIGDSPRRPRPPRPPRVG